jgi:hypothetical protein
MSAADITESESSEEEVSVCIWNQCLGCEECQNGEALRAKIRASQLSAEIEDLQRALIVAQEELEHIKRLQVAVCRHFLIVSATEVRCDRCGLSRPRSSG